MLILYLIKTIQIVLGLCINAAWQSDNESRFSFKKYPNKLRPNVC